MTRILKVYRAERFSPNSVERDRAIIDAAGDILTRHGYDVAGVRESELTGNVDAEVFMSMARTRQALAILKEKEREGHIVINSTVGVERCKRSTIDRLMRANHIPAAPLEGCDGYWIKRGDEAAQSKDDVAFAQKDDDKRCILSHFEQRGVTDVVVTAHVEGDLVKFYGVAGTGFFRSFRHAAGGYSKFGDEAVNGQPHGYGFGQDSLQADAERLASLAGIDIYGGDCIVRSDGTYAIIDFNDWPSFAVCRDEAAEAIAANIMFRINDKHKQKVKSK